MKLKELPSSIYRSKRLQLTNVKKFTSPEGKILPIIVSLTTIPSRLNVVHITIKSILIQNTIPKKIVLWLNKDIGRIPKKLKALESTFFEINYSSYNSPHRKLLHSLAKFPNDIIVTSDDDCIYNEGWLASLYNTYLDNKKCIVANRVRTITYNEKKELLPYKQWTYNPNNSEVFNLPIGAEGVLYPPGCFSDEVTDFSLAHELSPRADDLWYKAMSLKIGTKSILASNRPDKAIPLIGTQKISLKKENVSQDYNRTQWLNLTEYLNLDITI